MQSHVIHKRYVAHNLVQPVLISSMGGREPCIWLLVQECNHLVSHVDNNPQFNAHYIELLKAIFQCG